MTLRALLRDLTPPLLLRAVRGKGRGRDLRFDGDYTSWENARKGSAGYDSAEISRRVFEAEMKVRRGEAPDARDGVCFDKIEYSLPVMAALARAAAMHAGPLRVLDVGGALGGLYRQFKAFLPAAGLTWTVVEQPHYVDFGRKHFQNQDLHFCTSLDEALDGNSADVALLSSVLQYLPEPYELVKRIAASATRHVVIDRTPCSGLARDVLTVQTVPPQIYPASYPCWIFSRQRLLAAFGETHALLSAFTDGSGEWRSTVCAFELAGFILDGHR